MPRYIDADATQDRAFQLNFDFRITERELAIINRLLLEAPTADVVERKKGKWGSEWFDHKLKIVCSACGCFADKMTYYCPNCGAEMETTDDES